MQIASYQIHNVLKVYTRQLSQSRIWGRGKESAGSASTEKINLSAEGKRQSIIDKVASDIVARITRFGPQNEVEQGIVDQLVDEFGGQVAFKPEESEFVYHLIDEANVKQSATLSIEDSKFVTKRLEQLAKEAVDKNMTQPEAGGGGR